MWSPVATSPQSGGSCSTASTSRIVFVFLKSLCRAAIDDYGENQSPTRRANLFGVHDLRQPSTSEKSELESSLSITQCRGVRSRLSSASPNYASAARVRAGGLESGTESEYLVIPLLNGGTEMTALDGHHDCSHRLLRPIGKSLSCQPTLQALTQLPTGAIEARLNSLLSGPEDGCRLSHGSIFEFEQEKCFAQLIAHRIDWRTEMSTLLIQSNCV